ncbi:hypothetical protein SASPL_151178 [Salvia splendens]|uniref:WRKY19-like zinc finger domain-containing protein n=1 Tax=Salvia splendens TaxID=180675 RepID=A0A8X8W7W7_SALSN|nr:hypothetical protein SASPL_151178 [Salvia splendens]
MDGTLGNNITFASASNDQGKVVDSFICDLGFHSPGALGSFVSKGSKRKYNSSNQPIKFKDGSSLVLELGLPSSSCTTICSGKEAEEESSLDLGLSMNLNVGANMISNLKKVSGGKLNAVKMRSPVIDLQLSLSTETAESDVTSVTQEFIPCQNYYESLVLARQLNSQEMKDQHLLDGKTILLGARGASGLCIAHGGGRRCQKAGCQKGAEGKTVFCKAHGGGRRCQHLGCTKSAEGRTDHCIRHGGGRRCSHDDCTRASRGRSGLCIRHGGGKRCKIENCAKSARALLASAYLMGVGGAVNTPNVQRVLREAQCSAKLMAVAEGARIWDARKGLKGALRFVKAMVVGNDAHQKDAARVFTGHGGGKRCKFEGCPKSAQGSTDFCKAHGGGKRCSWGHLGSGLGSHDAVPCDKFARGKSGLCVAHSAQVQEEKTHGDFALGSATQGPSFSTSTQMNGVFAPGAGISYHGSTGAPSIGFGHVQASLPFAVGNICWDQMSLPEGRVHGGGLMAMLGGRTIAATADRIKESSG